MHILYKEHSIELQVDTYVHSVVYLHIIYYIYNNVMHAGYINV